MRKVSLVHKITKIAVDITFLLGVATCFLIPYFVKWWGELQNYNPKEMLEINIILIISGIVALFLVLQLRIILKNIVNGNPFIEQNVIALRRIALSTFIIMLIFGIKIILMFSLGSIIIFAAFGIATLIFLTIKDVFKQAVIYKEESDLTV